MGLFVQWHQSSTYNVFRTTYCACARTGSDLFDTQYVSDSDLHRTPLHATVHKICAAEQSRNTSNTLSIISFRSVQVHDLHNFN